MVKRSFTVLVGITFISAFINQYIYWNAFGVAAFEYINPLDTINYAIPILIIALLGSLPAFLALSAIKKPFMELVPKPFRTSALPIMVISWIIFSILLLSYSRFQESSWIAVYGSINMVISPFGAIVLSEYQYFREALPDQKVRIYICILACTFPLMTAGMAIKSADRVKNGDRVTYIEGADIKGGLENKKLIYVGKLGDYIFLIRDGEDSIVAYRHDDLIRFEPYKMP